MHDDLRIILPGPDPLLFERPVSVLRADTASEVADALAAAQAALVSGKFCAGYLSYELGAVFASRPVRPGRAIPLLTLGIYDAPGAAVPERAAAPYRMGPMVPRTPRAEYDRALAQIARAIYDGDVYQVNYTIPFDFAFEGDPYSLFCDLLATANVGNAAYVEDGAHAFVSISPELFLETRGGRVRTKPMKGTAPLEHLAELDTPKNRAEHVMIVDLLRNDLHRVCERVGVTKLYEAERYPTLGTMTSTVEGTLRPGVELAELLGATFPCGSITGAPKRAAMGIIESLEPSPRDVYTGSIGFIAPDGTSRWNVAIRTLQIDRARGRGRLDTGGGIVADSDAQSEWDELQLKRAFAQRFVEPFALLETFIAGSPRTAHHLDRLAASAKYFSVAFDRERTAEDLAALAPGMLVRLRLQADGSATVAVEQPAALREPVRVRLSAERVASTDPFLRHKTSWRARYDRALRSAHAAGDFDTIFLNERAELTEGARTNIFVEIGGTLYTPPLSSGVLPGILRAELLRQGRAQERVLYESDLHTGRALFAGNSARGLLRAELVKECHGV